MSAQHAKNHVRYYVPHHFIFYPLLLVLIIFSTRQAAMSANNKWEWIIITAGLVLIGWLSFMLRQHYALTLQNRIVRLEMRVRYFQLTGKRLDPLEQRLGFSRIAALRFCDDEQLPLLLDEVLVENLSPADIKQSIRHWQADHSRV